NGSAPQTTTSLTLIATRSIPTVSCFPARNASLSLVPTPSVPTTSTGSSYRLGTSKSPPNPPMPASTSGRIVRRACGLIRSTSASPSSMSTPESRYVSPMGRAPYQRSRRLGRDPARADGFDGQQDQHRRAAGDEVGYGCRLQRLLDQLAVEGVDHPHHADDLQPARPAEKVAEQRHRESPTEVRQKPLVDEDRPVPPVRQRLEERFHGLSLFLV